MSAPNGVGHSSSSKATDQDTVPGTGFQPQIKMKVVPPSRDDLQQDYAAEMGGERDPKGWYGGMSMSLLFLDRLPIHLFICVSFLTLFLDSQYSWRMYWNHGRISLLHYLPQPL